MSVKIAITSNGTLIWVSDFLNIHDAILEYCEEKYDPETEEGLNELMVKYVYEYGGIKETIDYFAISDQMAHEIEQIMDKKEQFDYIYNNGIKLQQIIQSDKIFPKKEK